MRRAIAIAVVLAGMLAGPSFALNPAPVFCIVPSPDGKTVAANLGGGAHVALFELATGRVLRTMECRSDADKAAIEKVAPEFIEIGYVRMMGFSPDGHFLACNTISDSPAVIWDIQSALTPPRYLQAIRGVSPAALHFTIDSKQLCSYMRADGTADDCLISWDCASGTERWRQGLGQDRVYYVSWPAPSGAIRVSGHNDDKPYTRWYDGDTGKLIAEPKVAVAASEPAPPWKVDTDAKKIVATSATGSTQTFVAADYVAAQTVSGNYIIAAVNSGLQVWNLNTGILAYTVGDITSPPGMDFPTDLPPAPPSANR